MTPKPAAKANGFHHLMAVRLRKEIDDELVDAIKLFIATSTSEKSRHNLLPHLLRRYRYHKTITTIAEQATQDIRIHLTAIGTTLHHLTKSRHLLPSTPLAHKYQHPLHNHLTLGLVH
jgi:hypothetical protein